MDNITDNDKMMTGVGKHMCGAAADLTINEMNHEMLQTDSKTEMFWQKSNAKSWPELDPPSSVCLACQFIISW